MATRRKSGGRSRGKYSRSVTEPQRTKWGFWLLVLVVLAGSLCSFYVGAGGYNQHLQQVYLGLQHTVDVLFAPPKVVKTSAKTPPAGHTHHSSSSSSPVKSSAPLKPHVAKSRPKYRLAIIIDDCGYNKLTLRELAALPLDLTFSFLPDGPYTQTLAPEVANAGRCVMLHLPMEPLNASKLSLEPNTLTPQMSESEIVSIVEEDLKKVGVASGVNNHMGSLATTDQHVCDTLARCLKGKRGPSGRQLFLVDSLTVPASTESLLGVAAARLRLPFFKRDVFLDDAPYARAMKRQAEQALELARTRGYAIMIGHCRPTTLEWLRANLDLFENSDVTVVGMDKLAYR